MAKSAILKSHPDDATDLWFVRADQPIGRILIASTNELYKLGKCR